MFFINSLQTLRLYLQIQDEILKLEFLEKGIYYNQTMIVDATLIEFNVPKQAGIEQTIHS